jgi:hypothetical protein
LQLASHAFLQKNWLVKRECEVYFGQRPSAATASVQTGGGGRRSGGTTGCGVAEAAGVTRWVAALSDARRAPFAFPEFVGATLATAAVDTGGATLAGGFAGEFKLADSAALDGAVTTGIFALVAGATACGVDGGLPVAAAGAP